MLLSATQDSSEPTNSRGQCRCCLYHPLACTRVCRPPYHAASLPTRKRCSFFRGQKIKTPCSEDGNVGSQSIQGPGYVPCAQLVIKAAGSRLFRRMRCVKFAWFRKRVVSGVVVRNTNVRCPLGYARCVFSIEKSKPVSFIETNKRSGKKNKR